MVSKGESYISKETYRSNNINNLFFLQLIKNFDNLFLI